MSIVLLQKSSSLSLSPIAAKNAFHPSLQKRELYTGHNTHITNHRINLRASKINCVFSLSDLIKKTSAKVADCQMLSIPRLVASICLKVIEQVTDGSLQATLKAHQLGKILVV